MRSFIVMAMFVASLSNAAWNGYTEDRDLELDTQGINTFEINAGAGSLVVTGIAELESIEVKARIYVPGEGADKAKKLIKEDLRLSLDKVRDRARLEAYFEHKSWGFGEQASVDLDVRVPHGLALVIDDGSGSLRIIDTNSDVAIDDGSGSIEIQQANSVVVDDGSGSIKIVRVLGNVSIEDGSGSITVEHVGGTVTIDDGSGGIKVKDVEHDLIIVDDGSGGLDASDVRGRIERDT